MTLMQRRRALVGQKKRNQHAIYLGETPVMNSSQNKNNATLVTLVQPQDSDFNYILVISKDRRAFKELAYHPSSLGQVMYGRTVFNTAPYAGSVNNNNFSLGFKIQGRSTTDNITIGFARLTSDSGNFFVYFPQVFEVYAISLPYEEGDIR